MSRTAYDVAADYARLGVVEKAGDKHNWIIMAMLRMFNAWPDGDEVAWCSAALTFFAFNAGREYSTSLLARSWLRVGVPIELDHARVGNDVVILKRGAEPQPGPDDLTAPAHVGLFAAATPETVFLLAGNQDDAVNIRGFPIKRVIGVRRLRTLGST